MRACVCVCVGGGARAPSRECVRSVCIRTGAQMLCIYRCSQFSIYDKDKGLTGIIIRFYIIIAKTQDCCNFISKYSGLTFNI